MRWRSCLGTDISDLWDVKNSEKAALPQQGRAVVLVSVAGGLMGSLFIRVIIDNYILRMVAVGDDLFRKYAEPSD